MAKKKLKRTQDGFGLMFLGEYVTILSKLVTTVDVETEHGPTSITTPIEFTGYLLDFDSRYLYLGDTMDGGVTNAMKRKMVAGCAITAPEMLAPIAKVDLTKKEYN